MKEIESKLRNRADQKELRQKVKDSMDALDNYLKKKTRWIELKDLQDEWGKLETAQNDLNAEAAKNGLEGNEDWKSLHKTLSDQKQSLGESQGKIERIVRFAAIFQTDENEFEGKVKSPAEALKTFQKANESDFQSSVFDERGSSYLDYLNYSLNRFISRHTPPEMKEADAKQWEAAVAEAKKVKERLAK